MRTLPAMDHVNAMILRINQRFPGLLINVPGVLKGLCRPEQGTTPVTV